MVPHTDGLPSTFFDMSFEDSRGRTFLAYSIVGKSLGAAMMTLQVDLTIHSRYRLCRRLSGFRFKDYIKKVLNLKESYMLR